MIRLLSSGYGSVIAALTTAALCSGCAVGPDFVRPKAPDVDAFTREPVVATATVGVHGGESQRLVSDSEVLPQWWTAFGSPALNELVEQALRHNPSIDSAKAALRVAHENVAAQYGVYFPVIQANYAGARQRNPVGTISPTLASGEPLYTLHTAQMSVGYVPDVFGLNRRTIESLAAQEEAQGFQLRAAYMTIATNVVSAAIQEASLSAQVQAANEIIASSRQALDLIRRQAELGAASDLDIATQASALAQAEQSLPPLVKQLEQTRNLIAVLTGRMPSQGVKGGFDLEALSLPRDLPVSLPSSLVERRPDVRAAEAQLHAASAQVGVVIANRLPQFSIVGLFGGTSTAFARMFSSDNKFWGISGNVGQTVFDFGTLRHRQLAAEAALEQVGAQYRSTVLTAFQNVADALHALQADAKTLVAAANAESAARRTLDLTRRQIELGAVNAFALFSAEQSYQQARLALIQAQAARFTDTAGLFLALGGGWPDAEQLSAVQ
ncbi:efflux transporter outer membrane subunit [uncultured Propionivibrio sp.]|uniref:efflux transporter outer membrane subunit n=1 Tax=uncultured Propionivibrio sp. TaxID=426737 RepID=UPI0029C0399F|nr:efflux transporter outer membrane subunit [uncultured Propionivibrio sp.]